MTQDSSPGQNSGGRAKLAGWFLLLLGLGIIVWAIYSNFSIFTGKTAAPEIFKIQQKQEIVETQSPESEGLLGIVEQMLGDQVGQQIQQTLPSIPNNAIVMMLNLFSWSIFSGVLIFAGTRIAGLGIKLIKK